MGTQMGKSGGKGYFVDFNTVTISTQLAFTTTRKGKGCFQAFLFFRDGNFAQ
jgi:hypothetical protein